MKEFFKMRKFFESKFTFTAVLSLIMLAFASVSMPTLADGDSHGPTMPPDPWAGFASMHKPVVVLSDGDSHGPTMPPDPWAGLV